MSLYYLDTSAAFKLLVDEPHADALTAFYREHLDEEWVSSDLLRIETVRSIRRDHPGQMPDTSALLDSFSFLPIDDETVLAAMNEPDPHLRSLDAIHLATARMLGPELTGLLTYDERLAAAAKDAGIEVIAPRDPEVPSG